MEYHTLEEINNNIATLVAALSKDGPNNEKLGDDLEKWTTFQAANPEHKRKLVMEETEANKQLEPLLLKYWEIQRPYIPDNIRELTKENLQTIYNQKLGKRLFDYRDAFLFLLDNPGDMNRFSIRHIRGAINSSKLDVVELGALLHVFKPDNDSNKQEFRKQIADKFNEKLRQVSDRDNPARNDVYYENGQLIHPRHDIITKVPLKTSTRIDVE